MAERSTEKARRCGACREGLYTHNPGDPRCELYGQPGATEAALRAAVGAMSRRLLSHGQMSSGWSDGRRLQGMLAATRPVEVVQADSASEVTGLPTGGRDDDALRVCLARLDLWAAALLDADRDEATTPVLPLARSLSKGLAELRLLVNDRVYPPGQESQNA